MGNCKKQHHKRPALDINELFRRIKFESKQSKRTFKDIEDLLNRTYQLMQRLQTTRNNRVVNGNTFLNVAELPEAPPIIPQPTPQAPPAPTLTPTQRRLVRDILEKGRRLRVLRGQLEFQAFLLFNEIREFGLGTISEDVFIASIFTIVGEIGRIQAEIEEVRGSLLATVLELEVSLGL
ncbi:hypothetical protein [Priestia megaterium]|uniref:hypothetical protein n=1 Tax=Priestia megaterium TaxID=1404 RepID=UPI0036DAAEBF